MRTTVTLDPDVEVLLRRAMRDRGAPFKQVLNSAVRDGLLLKGGAAQRGTRAAALPVFRMGVPEVDLNHANRMAERLEDEALLAKLRRRR